MPSRIFTQLDITGIVEGYLSGPATVNSSFNLSNTNFGDFGFNGLGSQAAAGAVNSNASASYRKTGTLDFTPLSRPIPLDALITRIKIRTPVSVNVSATATTTGANSRGASLVATAVTITGGVPLININEILSVFTGTFSKVWQESFQGSNSDHIVEFEPPISLTVLQATYGTIQITLTMTLACGTGGGNGSCSQSFSIDLDGWEFEVTYEEKYSWQVIQPDTPIDVGSLVDLYSPISADPPLEPIDFTDVTAIDIMVPDYSNPGTFFTVPVPLATWSNITTNTLRFEMPAFPVGNPTPTVVRARLTSTQFAGTVERQLYTIYFVSASGIYELVEGKTSDTLYIEEEPGETIDVKIPNPTGKTGFF